MTLEGAEARTTGSIPHLYHPVLTGSDQTCPVGNDKGGGVDPAELSRDGRRGAHTTGSIPQLYHPVLTGSDQTCPVGAKSLFENYQAASRLSIKRVIATYTNVSLVLGNSS